LFLWWRAREIFLEILLFAEIVSYAVAEKFLLPTISGQFVISMVALSVYNTMRSPEQLRNLLILPLPIVFHAFLMPFAHVWATCTMFEDSWGKTGRGTPLVGESNRAAGGLSPLHLGSAVWALIGTSFVMRLVVSVIGITFGRQ
jgi:hypothetical protein